MTDSQSILTTLTHHIQERIAAHKSELQMLRSGEMHVHVDKSGEMHDVSSDWITRLGEWITIDEALVARLGKSGG